MNKKIAKNSLYNVIYKGFNAIFPLIISAYVSHILKAEGVGKVTYANTIATYFSTLAALGLPSYGIKIIAQAGNNKQNREERFQELFFINFVSTLFFSFAYYSIVNFTDYFINRKLLFNTMGILVLLNFINVDWFYQGIEEYKYIAARSIIMKFISLVLLLFFVKNDSDYIIYSVILCISTAGNYIFNIIRLKKYLNIFNFNKLHIKQHVKPILILLASTVATEIYTMLDTVMIEFFHNETYVAYYSYSVKIVRMIYTVTIALVATFYPQISYFYKHRDYNEVNELLTKGLKIILVLAIPCSVGLYLTSNNLIPVLFGESFRNAIVSLQILSPLVLVFSIAYFLGHIVLMSTGNEKIILRATIVGAIVNFCLNITLIPTYKHYGAAFASVIAEIIVTTINIAKSKKYFKLNIKYTFIASIIFANLIMGCSVIIIGKLITNDLLCLILQCMFGVMSYFIGLSIMKNDVLLYLKGIFRRKVKR